MAVPGIQTPRLTELADRLVADIEARGLSHGDRYFTAAEAAKILGISTSIANRALQILERRGIIVRQQRRGAIIVDPLKRKPASLDRVHFLVHKKYLRTEGIGQDETLLGIEHRLPAVPVQLSFLPSGDETPFVKELISDSMRTKRTDGFVLVRASYETQSLFSQADLPVAVFGTVYPSIQNLAFLSADMFETGRQLGAHLLSRGHKRLAYFNRQLVFGGDQHTMDGIASAMRSVGSSVDKVTFRFLPGHREAYAAAAAQLFDQTGDRPTGFICRTVLMADAVMEVAEERGFVADRDFEVVVCDCYLRPGEQARYTWAKSVIDAEEQGRRLAELLIGQVENPAEPAGKHVMPVTLEHPLSEMRNGR
jgi:DNA-binding LacI/PurR family transcriptional regulator/DNA-binding transcriptional regulator YhcF (GntR family)